MATNANPTTPSTALDDLVKAKADAAAPMGSPADPPTPPPSSTTDTDLGATRRNIAYFLLWIMVGVIAIVVVVALMFSVRCWVAESTCAAAETALGMLTTTVSPIFTAMIGLVGSVVGFYFGSKQS